MTSDKQCTTSAQSTKKEITPIISHRKLNEYEDSTYLDAEVTGMGEDNHPLLWQAPSLINAFKKAYCHNIKTMKEAQENFVHFQKLERTALSNQALAL